MFSRLTAALSFLISLVVYTMTVAPDTSFWDCGEFIACSYRLAIPHPPGAPFYLLMGRFFSMLPLGEVAFRVNMFSVISSAFTILFLHLIIVNLVREYMDRLKGFRSYIPSIAGMVGALTFAFTESFWFNAVEAEVYAQSMFFSSIIVWLALYWTEKHEEPGNERYLILATYLMGLAMGVHILNALIIPTIVMFIYYKRYEFTPISFIIMSAIGVGITLFFYPGIVKGIPQIIGWVGFEGTLVAVLVLIFALYQSFNARKSILSLVLLGTILITLGYSSYMMIYIRSGLNPNIDENNPETIENFISYMNREQYGDHHFDRARRLQESPNGNKYANSSDFFWNYQINEMYVRYFNCNFLGTYDGDGTGLIGKMRSDPFKFYMLPLLLGFIGMAYHGMKDWRRALAVFVLFFMTGLAIVLYLNQPDPQPRERDYSYVGSFFAFSIWIGIGAAAILELVTDALSGDDEGGNAMVGWVTAALLLLVPAIVCSKNYRTHDRSGNYVAYDYSYNMLQAADENGIILTNGDNDTFPLWYLQEVKGIRTDVRVANLSLLNTPWYIQQLKDMEPKVPMTYSDDQIANIQVRYWPESQRFKVPLPSDNEMRAEAERYRVSMDLDSVNVPTQMSFEVKPKHFVPQPNGQQVGLLRVQDLMILNMLTANRFKKPLYFAVTTSTQNQLDGLRDYLRMEGLLFKVTPIKNWEVDLDNMYDNVMNKFQYRNLDNPDVFYNDNIIGLLQNYRSAFFRLGAGYMERGNMERFEEVIKRCFEIMPPDVIPYTNNQFKQVMIGLGYMAGVYPMENLQDGTLPLFDLESYAQIAYTYKNYEFAQNALSIFIDRVEADKESQAVQEYMQSLFRRPEYFTNSSPAERLTLLNNRLNLNKQQLVRSMRETGKLDEAMRYLDEWEKTSPTNTTIQQERERLNKLMQEAN